jgi:hypothetical protein
MASLTQKTKRQRALKMKKAGRKRKKQLAKNGSTPKFSIDPKND